MNAINEMKAQMKDAKDSNKDLSSEIDAILDTDIHNYGYRQTQLFRDKMEALFKKVKIPQREPEFPIFDID